MRVGHVEIQERMLKMSGMLFAVILVAICGVIIGALLVQEGHTALSRIATFLVFLVMAVCLAVVGGGLRTYEDTLDYYKWLTTPVDNAYYYEPAEIVDQSVAGTTVFETDDGQLYSFETNPEWCWNCEYLLTMDDNATPNNPKDDIVVVVWAENTWPSEEGVG